MVILTGEAAQARSASRSQASVFFAPRPAVRSPCTVHRMAVTVIRSAMHGSHFAKFGNTVLAGSIELAPLATGDRGNRHEGSSGSGTRDHTASGEGRAVIVGCLLRWLSRSFFVFFQLHSPTLHDS